MASHDQRPLDATSILNETKIHAKAGGIHYQSKINLQLNI